MADSEAKSSNPQDPVEGTETEAPSKTESEIDPDEIRSVKELIVQLTKTAKTLKIYLPNNPIYQKFLQQLYSRFDVHLKEYGELKLRVQQYDLFYRGNAVYNNLSPLDSLAFKLYADGIRELSFQKGLELTEVTDLLEILGRKYDTNDPDDDIVTLLWERRLAHIDYIVSEDFIHASVSQDQSRPPNTEGFQRMVQQEASASRSDLSNSDSALQKHLGLRLEGQTLTEIFTLSETEVARIKNEMKKEEVRYSISILLDILFMILKIEKQEKAFTDTVDILDSLLQNFVARAEFPPAVRILSVYHDLMRPVHDLSMANQEGLKKSIQKLNESSRIRELEAVLNQAELVNRIDQLETFFLLLGRGAIEPLVRLLGQLSQMKPRRTLCEALVELCKDDAEQLLKHLGDSRWYVVRNVVYVLGKIANPKALDGLKTVVMHKEPRVRKELVQALDRIKTPGAKDLLIRCMQDPDSGIRLLTIRSLANARYRPAAERIQEVIYGASFLAWDPKEKKEWFSALGQIGGNDAIPVFRRFLRQGNRAWFLRAVKEEMALCAVEGLKKIATDQSLAVLVEAQRTSRKKIREGCAQAMKGMTK